MRQRCLSVGSATVLRISMPDELNRGARSSHKLRSGRSPHMHYLSSRLLHGTPAALVKFTENRGPLKKRLPNCSHNRQTDYLITPSSLIPARNQGYMHFIIILQTHTHTHSVPWTRRRPRKLSGICFMSSLS